MKVIVQRVLNSSCTIDNKLISKIDKGYMLLVGFCNSDTKDNVDKMVKKISKLRIFEDENGKMNLDIHQVNGSILSISQFTLLADTNSGNRPSFTNALKPEESTKLYDYFNDELRKENLIVETGVFGADMKIELINDGPVTIILEN